MPAFGGKADIEIALRDVRFWPVADMPSCTAHVRFRGRYWGKADMPVCTAYVR